MRVLFSLLIVSAALNVFAQQESFEEMLLEIGGDIYEFNAEEMRLTQITIDGGRYNSRIDNMDHSKQVSVSPDGTQVVYEYHEDLYVLDVLDQHERQLLNRPRFYDANPKWSPDGERIAFVSQAWETSDSDSEEDLDTGWNLFVVDADGTNLRRLTEYSSLNRFDFEWLPFSDDIVFSSIGDDHDQLFRLDLSNNELVQLTKIQYPEDLDESIYNFPIHLEVAPNGESIIFQPFEQGDCAFFTFPLFMMDANGSNIRKLVEGEYCSLIEETLYISLGDWSPDSQYFAFDIDRWGHKDIVTVSVIDGEAKDVTADYDASYFHFEAWTPDGKSIIYTSDQGLVCTLGEGQVCSALFIMDSDGTNSRKLMDLYVH